MNRREAVPCLGPKKHLWGVVSLMLFHSGLMLFHIQFPPADASSLNEAVPSESVSSVIQNGLLSPLLTETESPFDLEQQWQDLMSIMEIQVGSCSCQSLCNGYL